MSHQLGRLQAVDLREVWLSEPGDFTPWLAEEENLALLADTLGIDLELVDQEKHVGPYRADIVCRDTTDGTLVLIENQLEKTDHTHLGQLMTYAAGLDAVTIVWIAGRFTDEHRAALDWLNETTREGMGFFGIEIELCRIGDSPIAPRFNVVSRPNEWTKRSGGSGAVTATQQHQLEYWTAFVDGLAERQSHLKPQSPQASHYLIVAVGRSGFNIAAYTDTRQDLIAVELRFSCPDAPQHFERLKAEQSEIEASIGAPLDWREPTTKAAYRILLERRNTDIWKRE